MRVRLQQRANNEGKENPLSHGHASLGRHRQYTSNVFFDGIMTARTEINHLNAFSLPTYIIFSLHKGK